MQCHHLNMHTQPSNGARGLIFGLESSSSSLLCVCKQQRPDKSLCEYVGSPEHMLAYVINTKISWAASYLQALKKHYGI